MTKGGQKMKVDCCGDETVTLNVTKGVDHGTEIPRSLAPMVCHLLKTARKQGHYSLQVVGVCAELMRRDGRLVQISPHSKQGRILRVKARCGNGRHNTITAHLHVPVAEDSDECCRELSRVATALNNARWASFDFKEEKALSQAQRLRQAAQAPSLPQTPTTQDTTPLSDVLAQLSTEEQGLAVILDDVAKVVGDPYVCKSAALKQTIYKYSEKGDLRGVLATTIAKLKRLGWVVSVATDTGDALQIADVFLELFARAPASTRFENAAPKSRKRAVAEVSTGVGATDVVAVDSSTLSQLLLSDIERLKALVDEQMSMERQCAELQARIATVGVEIRTLRSQLRGNVYLKLLLGDED